MIDDPIVAEVRETRKKFEASYNNDFKAFYKQMIDLQQQYSDRLVTSPLPLQVVIWPTQHQLAPDAANRAFWHTHRQTAECIAHSRDITTFRETAPPP